MNNLEKPNLVPEKTQEELDEEMFEFITNLHPKKESALENEKESESKGVSEFENMVESFEAAYPLEKLHSILEISHDVYLLSRYYFDMHNEGGMEKIRDSIAVNNPGYLKEYEAIMESLKSPNILPEDVAIASFRNEAKQALIPILEKLKQVGDRNGELQAKYSRLSKAVGALASDKVRHD